VLLVADIDRGGVFAALVGTLELLDAADRARVRGLLINRFRGDRSLLEPGLRFLQERTGCPVLGVIPYLSGLHLPAEDSQSLDSAAASGPAPIRGGGGGSSGGEDRPVIDVAVIRFPRIANFDDFSPLEAEPGVRVRYVRDSVALGVPDLLALPGTKGTLADLAWLRASGLGVALLRLAAAGTPILGICGGFQMLGTRLADPDGTDGDPADLAGLGLLDVATEFSPDKATRHVQGEVVAEGGFFGCAVGLPVAGYEIHLGRATGRAAPFAQVAGAPDGAVAADGLVAGTYLHGLFHNDAVRRALLAALARRRGVVLPAGAVADDPYDRLADAVAASVDLPRLYALCQLPIKEHA
jgi:adenosylcobyric acid synthase